MDVWWHLRVACWGPIYWHAELSKWIYHWCVRRAGRHDGPAAGFPAVPTRSDASGRARVRAGPARVGHPDGTQEGRQEPWAAT